MITALVATSSLLRPCLELSVIIIATTSGLGIDTGFIITSLVITGATVFITVLVTTLQITIPLRRIEESMEAASQLDFDKQPPGSKLKEISNISKTFKKLRDGILVLNIKELIL